jgi:hypothetical protein
MPKKKKGGRGAQKRVVKVRLAGGAGYEGQVDRNRTPNGEGVLTCPNGNCFEGTFVAGMLEGHGVMTSLDGIRFEGTFMAGVLEGHGVMTAPDGARYEGQHVNAQPEGHGVFVYADGDRYDGQFVGGKKEGHGILAFADGTRYDGQFADDKLEGQGTFTFGDDNASWEGTWSSGRTIGIGTWHFDCDGPAGGGTGRLHFSGDGPTDAEMFACAAPAKWAQLAAEKAAAAQQQALSESKPAVTDDDGADDGGGGGGGGGGGTDDDDKHDDDDDDDDGSIFSVVGALPAPQCELSIAEPQPTHAAAIEGDRARGCHQCSARKTRAGAKLKLKWCSACMCARYCSEECHVPRQMPRGGPVLPHAANASDASRWSERQR